MTKVVEHGPLSATVLGRRMPRWFVDELGHRYEFSRIAEINKKGGVELFQLADDECLLAPGVVYVRTVEGSHATHADMPTVSH